MLRSNPFFGHMSLRNCRFRLFSSVLPRGPTRSGTSVTFSTAQRVFPIETIEVPGLLYSRNTNHVAQVSTILGDAGILKLSLLFPDPKSDYLSQLVLGLHNNHNHHLPITHSGLRGAFWDVRPAVSNFQGGTYQARSETMKNFPWHTDCCYEEYPPRYFALHVLQHDRHGGGALSVMSVNKILDHLSPKAINALSRPEFKIMVPQEFMKNPTKRWIFGSILTPHHPNKGISIRFRRDLISAVTTRASQALAELDLLLQDATVQSSSSLRLSAQDLPRGSVIVIDNRKWLHARNQIKDQERHLRRVRWDAVPLGNEGT
ncbi:unnamed protein product [Periconia digitata]|uniref:TauD/TfdA-like domain-containing protein n=1 Tax=Periconia digitata TaxID=1303443 RepID=A0A9W4XPU8_9PLEO|nr:unnamed protein product [Periconia digitata]